MADGRAQMAAALFGAALGGGAVAGRRWEKAAGRLKNTAEELEALEAKVLLGPPQSAALRAAGGAPSSTEEQPAAKQPRARRPARLLRLGLLLHLGALLAAHLG